jgi:hypothetical protein
MHVLQVQGGQARSRREEAERTDGRLEMIMTPRLMGGMNLKYYLNSHN